MNADVYVGMRRYTSTCGINDDECKAHTYNSSKSSNNRFEDLLSVYQTNHVTLNRMGIRGIGRTCSDPKI